MAIDKRKWYVVWQGTEPGVCDSWAECELRVKGFPGARYKAFDTQQEAVEA
ncbi:MAG: RNase H1/viroplasmin domain-containing protein, partial [Muribaculaceae bacterium]|nr:RNase H1/viroplasmin domain-containing protein [Muribaculaceae bacterium]